MSLAVGDILLAFVGAGGTQNLTAFSDNTGGTAAWVVDYSSGSLTNARRFHVARTRVTSAVASGSYTFTGTLSAASANRGMAIIKISGVSGVSPQIYSTYDKVVSSTPSATAISGTSNGTDYSYTATTGSVTPSVGDEIVFAALSNSTNFTGTGGGTTASGYTMLTNSPSFVNYLGVAYALQGDTPSSTSTTFSWTSGGATAVLEYGLISYSVVTTASDTGSGADSVSSQTLDASVAETGSGAESASTSFNLSANDSGSGSEARKHRSWFPCFGHWHRQREHPGGSWCLRHRQRC
jgi:hypothetical protein